MTPPPLLSALFPVLILRQRQSISPATKVGGRWEAHARDPEVRTSNIRNPNEKSNALLHVSRNSRLTLLYQNESGAWKSTSAVLEPIETSEQVITHAAIGEHGENAIAVTHDLSSRIRVYQISINWNASQPRQPGQAVSVSPSLQISHLTVVDNIHSQHSGAAVLNILRILPAITDSSRGVSSPTTIIAGLTHAVPPSGLHTSPAFSVIAQWCIETVQPALHESFKKMKTGPDTSSTLAQVTILKRQPDVITSKTIVSLDTQVTDDAMLAVSASDGSMDLRDRFSMSSLEPYGETIQVTSLAQSGFGHVAEPHHLHTAMSTDGCCLAIADPKDRLLIKPMSFRYGWQVVNDEIVDNQALVEAGAVCIARQYVLACYVHASGDEPLALLPPHANHETRALVNSMIVRTLTPRIDIALLDPGIQRTRATEEGMYRGMAAQLAIGTDFKTGRRDFAGQFAHTTLSLHSLISAFMCVNSILLHAQRQTGIKHNLPTGLIISFNGHTRWTHNLAIAIVNTLVKIKQEVADNTDSTALQALVKLTTETHCPFAHILLSAPSRIMLRSLAQMVTRYLEMANNNLNQTKSEYERTQLTDLISEVAQFPFKLSLFEAMMTDFDNTIRNEYPKSGARSGQRADNEWAMICEGHVPEDLRSAIDVLLKESLSKLLDGTDLGKLYLWDTSSVAQSHVGRAADGKRYDVIRKTPLASNMKIRVCRRCGSETEDISTQKDAPLWLKNESKLCICKSLWMQD
jgi:mediator of RNA polymerase II transcription subunit 16